MDKVETILMEKQPYNLSLVDRFNAWIERLPVPALVFHIPLGLALILVQTLFLWLKDDLYAGELLPVIIFNSAAVPFLLIMIHLLNKQAVAAVNSIHSLIDMCQAE